MAEAPISLSSVSLVTFSGNDPNQNALEFWNSIDQKVKFSLGTTIPTDPDKKKSYEGRQRSLFGSLLSDTALEWFNNIDEAKNLTDIKKEFLDRFTDGRDKFKFRIEVENATRQEGELIKNYFHRVKHAVDRGWPEDLTGATDVAQEKLIQERQREQKYIDFAIRGLRPPQLKRKAHERRIKKPKENWQEFQDHLITQDLTCLVVNEDITSGTSSSKSSSDKVNSLENQIKELTSLLKSNEVNAIQGPSSSRDPNIKGRANNTRFCDYCRNHGHSISTCNKKKLDDEIQKIRKELLEQKVHKPTFSNNYKRGNWNSNYSNSRPNNYNQRGMNQNSNNYNQRNSYNFGPPKYGNKFNQNRQYDQKFPRENQFRQNEYAAKQYYDRENNRYNDRQINSNIKATATHQDLRNYQAQEENNVRWIQEESTVDYCDAITDFFPLNY